MYYFLDVTNVIALLLVVAIAIAGIVIFRAIVNPVPRTYVRGFRACPSGTSEHSSLHLRTGRSVVRGKEKGT